MKKFILIISLACASFMTSGQSKKLSVGDAAPPLKYAKWLKGNPIEKFDPKKTYVLEFWATWCGPCIAAMPHLSALAKKYEKDVRFIGVNVFERTGTKPYESSLPEVKAFVNGKNSKMTYDVITDNNEQHMGEKWLKAAGLFSIPQTIVIKEEKIIWIGNPMELDKVIDAIISNTFNMSAYKKNYEAESNKSKTEDLVKMFTDIQSEAAAKHFDKAFELIEQGIVKYPPMTDALKLEKFKILISNFTEREAMDFAIELNKSSQNITIPLSIAIADRPNLSKSAYQFAIDGMLKGDLNYSANQDRLAKTYYMAGNLTEAIIAQKKAINLAESEMSKPNYTGKVTEFTVKSYQDKLEQYEKTAIKK